MTTYASNPIDEALTIARRLSRKERAQLVAALVAELAEDPVAPLATPDDAWVRLQAFIIDFHATYPSANVAGQLIGDRREYEASLIGESDHVHD